MNKNYCVYEHVFPNGKKYIGISCDAEKRWRNGKGYETQPKIARAINKYGWNNIKHEVLIDGLTQEQAEKIEALLIQAYDSIENGYNTSIGGNKINASYLNEHVLHMIRESKEIDEKYGCEQKDDDIISIAEKAKYDKEYADIFNRADELIETIYDEYKKYKGTSIMIDFAEVRVDCYWWTMARVISNSMPEGKSPYWDFWRKQTWQLEGNVE